MTRISAIGALVALLGASACDVPCTEEDSKETCEPPEPAEPPAVAYSGLDVAWTGEAYRIVYTRSQGADEIRTAVVGAYADGGVVGDDEPVHAGEVYARGAARIAARDDGYLIAWSDRATALEGAIGAAWFGPGPGERALVPVGLDGELVGLAAGADGYLVLSSARGELFATPIAADGSSWGASMSLGDTDWRLPPVLAATADGYAAAWRDSAELDNLVVALLDGDGARRASGTAEVAASGVHSTSPLAVLDGELRVFINREDPAEPGLDVRVGADGAFTAEPTTLGAAVVGLAAALDGSDLVVTAADGRGAQLAATHTDALGTRRTIELGIGSWSHTAVAAAPDGSFLLGIRVEDASIDDSGLDLAHIIPIPDGLDAEREPYARNIAERSSVGCAASTPDPGTLVVLLALLALARLRKVSGTFR